MILAARLIDRFGKGVRGAPRDALIADLAPAHLRGASFGLRQSLDTVGAFVGPLIAATLMLVWQNDFRRVFWVAVIPGVLSVVLLLIGIKEPAEVVVHERRNPLNKQNLARLDRHYWWVVTLASIFTLARFSEAFLVLRAQQIGVPIGLVPLVMVAMNIVYSASAYPFGKLADRISHMRLLGLGIAVLIGSDIFLATASQWGQLLFGVCLWGIHLGLTQGLLSKLVADASPVDLRGTAYGFFNLMSGVSLLMASTLAGLLWERFGAPVTFFSGILFCVISLVVMWYRPRGNSPRN